MTLAEQIAAAKGEGYTDTEIAQALGGHTAIATAKKEGFSDTDVFGHLGLKPIPGKFGLQIENAAKAQNIDPRMLWGLIQTESGGRPEAVGPDVTLPGPRSPGNEKINARGLAQLIPSTAKALGVTDPHDPDQAIPAAAKLLRQNLDHYDGDVEKALKAYYGGWDQKNWGKDTNAYPDKVFSARNQAFGLSGKDLAPSGPDWNGWKNTANAYVLNAGVPAEAAGVAIRQGYENWKNGMPAADALSLSVKSVYPQAVDSIHAAKTAYQTENPVSSVLQEVAGSTASLVPALGMAARVGPSLVKGGLEAFAPGAGVLADPALRFAAGETGGNLLTRMASRGTAGAISGAATGAATSGLTDGSLSNNTLMGAVTGGILGTAAPVASRLWNNTFGSEIDPITAKTILDLKSQGVPVRFGQTPGAAPIAQGANTIFGKKSIGQDDAIHQAVARTIGQDTTSITTDTLKAAKREYGQKLDDLVRGKVAGPGGFEPTLFNNLTREAHNIDSDVGLSTEVKNNLKNIISEVKKELASGGISGDTYRDFTKFDSILGRAQRNPLGDVRYFAGQIRDHLNESFENTMTTAERAAYKEAKYRYKNAVTLDAATDDATGKLNYRKLLTAVERKYGSAQDAGELGKIALGAELLNRPSGAKMGLTGKLGLGLLGATGAEELATNPHLWTPALATAAGVGTVGGVLQAGYQGAGNRLLKQAASGQEGLPSTLAKRVVIPAFSQVPKYFPGTSQ